MIDVDKWQEIFRTLGQHKMRTVLTAFGVFWGFFLLISLVGVSKGLENGVLENFPPTKNFISIWAQNKTQLPYQGLPLGREIILTPNDVMNIKANVPRVGSAWGRNILGGSVRTFYKDQSGNFAVEGNYAELKDIAATRILKGRFLNTIDNVERRKVVIIGSQVYSQLFNNTENVIGEVISIFGTHFTVIGVFDSYSARDQQSESQKIYMPNDTLQHEFHELDYVSNILVLPVYGNDASTMEQDLKNYLYKIKVIDMHDLGIFGSFNLQSEYDKFNGLFSGMKIFCWVVAIATIAAGAIGVSNIMLIITKERTREIGLRKALGATSRTIILMIVQESVLITFIAGYAGLCAGVYLLDLLNQMIESNADGNLFFRHPKIDLFISFVAFLVLLLAGILSSLLPAARAANIEPTEALRHE